MTYSRDPAAVDEALSLGWDVFEVLGGAVAVPHGTEVVAGLTVGILMSKLRDRPPLIHADEADGQCAARREVSDARIAEWKASGHKYKVIAAAIAEWARKQQPGTVLETNEFFAGNLPFTASVEPWKRAKIFLAGQGVIYRNDGPYGPYQVAEPQNERQARG